MSSANTTNTAASTSNAVAASASEEKKKIVLSSSDGHIFEVDEKVALQSVTIQNTIEDCDGGVIPLLNITAETLAKVLEFCNHHANAAPAVGDQKSDDDDIFDSDLTKELTNGDQKVLFDLILAANYLDIKGLLDLTCKTVADMIKGKSVEEIRNTFNIVNDFTPEEEEEVRKQNQWAFE